MKRKAEEEAGDTPIPGVEGSTGRSTHRKKRKRGKKKKFGRKGVTQDENQIGQLPADSTIFPSEFTRTELMVPPEKHWIDNAIDLSPKLDQNSPQPDEPTPIDDASTPTTESESSEGDDDNTPEQVHASPTPEPIKPNRAVLKRTILPRLPQAPGLRPSAVSTFGNVIAAQKASSVPTRSTMKDAAKRFEEFARFIENDDSDDDDSSSSDGSEADLRHDRVQRQESVVKPASTSDSVVDGQSVNPVLSSLDVDESRHDSEDDFHEDDAEVDLEAEDVEMDDVEPVLEVPQGMEIERDDSSDGGGPEEEVEEVDREVEVEEDEVDEEDEEPEGADGEVDDADKEVEEEADEDVDEEVNEDVYEVGGGVEKDSDAEVEEEAEGVLDEVEVEEQVDGEVEKVVAGIEEVSEDVDEDVDADVEKERIDEAGEIVEGADEVVDESEVEEDQNEEAEKEADPSPLDVHPNASQESAGDSASDRNWSFLGQRPGGIGSDHLSDHDPILATEPSEVFPSSLSETEKEIQQDIKDISQDVFNFTRPIPFGKHTQDSNSSHPRLIPPTSSHPRLISPPEPERQAEPLSLPRGASGTDWSDCAQTSDDAKSKGHKEENISDRKITKKSRRMTGCTSKHFSPEKNIRPPKAEKCKVVADDTPAERVTRSKTARSTKAQTAEDGAEPKPTTRKARSKKADSQADKAEDTPEAESTEKLTRSSKRRVTRSKSDYFLPLDLLDRVDLPSPSKGRAPAGVSVAPVPPITADKFGIIQEKLWREPFWLLIAVILLNKTTGRAAIPTFWKIRNVYPTPEALSQASQPDLQDMIHHCGLQVQRSRNMIKLSQIWLSDPPQRGKRHRVLHYPNKGDGKELKRNQMIEEDDSSAIGAIEISHLPGCGHYAYDSWRIFCRDVLRGVATDYNGQGAAVATSANNDDNFEPEWKRVLPGDKELRATLRWMWLREGWIWNHENGEKRRANADEMARAVKGEMEVADEEERRFAVRAVAVAEEEAAEKSS